MARKVYTMWKPRFVVDIYRLRRQGHSDRSIASALSTSAPNFINWKKSKASVRYALRQAEKDKKELDSMSIQDYIGNRLSSNVKDVFKQITGWNQERYGYTKVVKMLKTKPKQFQQELFVYTLIVNNLNVSRALKKLGIDRRVFKGWLENDIKFVEMMSEVKEMIGDFYQEGLLNLVAKGDSSATQFANKTFNRERGYGEVTEKRITSTLEVKSLPLEQLNLPVDILRTVLNAVKEYENSQIKRLPVTSEVIDNEDIV